MIDLFFLGLKDIFRYFRLFFLLLVSVFIITIIFVSGTLSAFYSEPSDTSKFNEIYDLVPVSTDMTGNRDLADRFQEWINGKGMAYVSSQYLNKMTGMTTYVVTGDPVLFHPQMEKTDHLQVYEANGVGGETEIRFGGNAYPLKQIRMEVETLSGPISDMGESETFLVVYVSGEKISDWINYEDGFAVWRLMNTAILYEDAAINEGELKDMLEGSFLALSKYSDNPIYNQLGEYKFVTGYLYPCLLLMIFCVFLFFRMFYEHFLRQMYQEYTVHILYGAGLRDIVLRNSMLMFLSLLILFFGFWYISRGEPTPIRSIGYLLIGGMLGMLELLMVWILCRSDRLKNVKGVD